MTVPLPTGSRIGTYEIIDAIGAGGMGEVYRARDSRLGREVALKVLPEGFASDRDRVARFEREAQLLASLNHPHIAHIHGIESSSESPALVMELVEGPTLAERLRDGPISLDEAALIARQIAEALEAAHQRGIIHRDLKPANIKVTDEGVVKILDFGLAKASEPAGAPGSVSQSPTISLHATQAGVILGTAAYMSPEQARGKPVDARADIWAFGAVLFEMLTGRRAFDGEDTSETLANVIKADPPWQQLPDVPPAMVRLLRRCLQKDPRQRLQHIGDARLELDDLRQPDEVTGPRRSVAMRERILWATALAAAIVALMLVMRKPAAVPQPEMRLDVPTPEANVMFFSVSPDGQSVAYSGRTERGLQIWVRRLSAQQAQPLGGTEGGELPFWSADGRHLGFFAGGRLKRVAVDGGAATVLGGSTTPAGGTWADDGTILYVPADNGPVSAISEKGGESRPATPPGIAARLPQFLPGGRRFLFYASSGIQPTGVYVGELGKQEITHVTSADWPALFVSNNLVFVRDRVLYGQPFNPNTLALSGSPVRITENVGAGLFAANFSVSRDIVAYRTGSGGRQGRQLMWIDRAGKRLEMIGDEGFLVSNPALSPDGRRVAVQRTTAANVDIWLIDLARNVPSRLTNQPAVESMPIWSPDGSRIAFSQTANTDGPVVVSIDRPSEMTSLGLPGSGPAILTDWSRDGRYVMYKAQNRDTGTFDLWAVPLEGERTPMAVSASGFDERDGQFSPDGRWVAFESDESGVSEIYVQPFPGPGRRERVSTNGGTQVRWRADGRELYYIAPDETLIAVAVSNDGKDLSFGASSKLFKTNIAPVRTISRQQYAVARDGQRFLILMSDLAPVPPATFVLNWAMARR